MFLTKGENKVLCVSNPDLKRVRPRAVDASQGIMERAELWRLLTSNVVFTTPGEAIFGKAVQQVGASG